MTAEVLATPAIAPLPAPSEQGRVRLGPSEAAVYETFVVPRYMSFFGELAIEMLIESEDAQVVHLHCRTGYPDRGVATKLRGAHLVGVDGSPAALELARAKASTSPDMVSQYWLAHELPTSLPASAFSHALALHPLGLADDRSKIVEECARLLADNGQVIVAMPVNGSFQEISDLLREYSLKHDDAAVGRAADEEALSRPTVEELGAELEQAGFDFVELALRPITMRFASGRAFFEDPVARLVIIPELRFGMDLEEKGTPFSYVCDAIDTYWSEGSFELSVNVGCATGRKIA